MQFELTDQANEAEQAIIKSGVKSFNDGCSAAFKSLRANGKQVLDIIIRDSHASVVGGLLGKTYWQWLYIDELWVDLKHRKKGYGRRLVEQAEAEAKKRGCTNIHVKTWSFQAKGFYEKLGFHVVGELKDYPIDESLFWMCKSIKE